MIFHSYVSLPCRVYQICKIYGTFLKMLNKKPLDFGQLNPSTGPGWDAGSKACGKANDKLTIKGTNMMVSSHL